MTISPDRRTVYYADRLKNILFLIDAATYEVRQVPFPAGLKGIGAMAVSAEGRYVYVGVQRSEAPGEAQPGTGGPSVPASSPPGGAAIAVYDTKLRRYAATIRLVDLDRVDSEGNLRPADGGWPTGMAFSEDGSRLYVTVISSDVAVYVIDVRANKLEQLLRFKRPASTRPDPDAHSPLVYDGRLLVSLRNYRQLKIIDLAAPRRVVTVENWPDSNMSGMTPMLRIGRQLFYGDLEHNRVYLKDLRKDEWWIPTRPVGEGGAVDPASSGRPDGP
jgi:DNA-binding beta-propeller fold protein YncE